MTDRMHKERWVCMGRKYDGNKRVVSFGFVIASAKGPHPRIDYTFTVPNAATFNATSCGAVYEVTCNTDKPGNFMVSGPDCPKWIESWHDEKKVAIWKATELALEKVKAAEKQEKAFGNECLEDLLRPLANHRRNLSPAAQAAFDILILQKLRGIRS